MSVPVLSVRMSVDERDLLERAAKASRTSLSDFARRRLVVAAELELMTDPRVTIPAENWARFEAWAAAPGRKDPTLERLAKSRPAWED